MFRSNFDDFSGADHNWCCQSLKPDPDDYVWHPKQTYTICSAVSIAFCQYGWKIIRWCFAEFSGLGTTEAGKVENRARITPFCTRNIPTIFMMQFLSFCNLYGWKMFQTNFHKFLGLEHHHCRQRWKLAANDSNLTAEIYPHYLGCISCRFWFVPVKTVSEKFLRDFRARTRQWRKSWKWGQITRLSARNIPTLFGVQFLSFRISTTKKYFGRILTTFPKSSTTGAAKVENRTQMTMFGTPNILTQFVVQFLLLPVNTVEK